MIGALLIVVVLLGRGGHRGLAAAALRESAEVRRP